MERCVKYKNLFYKLVKAKIVPGDLFYMDFFGKVEVMKDTDYGAFNPNKMGSYKLIPIDAPVKGTELIDCDAFAFPSLLNKKAKSNAINQVKHLFAGVEESEIPWKLGSVDCELRFDSDGNIYKINI